MATGAAGSESDRPASISPPSVLPGDSRSYFEERPPKTGGDAGTWFFMALGGFVAGQLLGLVVLYIIAAFNGHESDLAVLEAKTVPPAWVVVGGLVGLWIGFLGAVVLASRSRGTGNIVADMGLRIRPWDPLIGLGAGLFGQFILVNLLYLPFEHIDRHLSQELAQPAKHLTGGFPGVDLVVIGVLTVVFVPVIEELFFRGLVLRSFLRLFGGAGRILGPALAVTVTGIVFGLAHAELLETLGLAAFGIVLSVLAYKFQRLGPGIFAHATFNLAAVLAIAHQTGAIR